MNRIIACVLFAVFALSANAQKSYRSPIPARVRDAAGAQSSDSLPAGRWEKGVATLKGVLYGRSEQGSYAVRIARFNPLGEPSHLLVEVDERGIFEAKVPLLTRVQPVFVNLDVNRCHNCFEAYGVMLLEAGGTVTVHFDFGALAARKASDGNGEDRYVAFEGALADVNDAVFSGKGKGIIWGDWTRWRKHLKETKGIDIRPGFNDSYYDEVARFQADTEKKIAAMPVSGRAKRWLTLFSRFSNYRAIFGTNMDDRSRPDNGPCRVPRSYFELLADPRFAVGDEGMFHMLLDSYGDCMAAACKRSDDPLAVEALEDLGAGAVPRKPRAYYEERFAALFPVMPDYVLDYLLCRNVLDALRQGAAADEERILASLALIENPLLRETLLRKDRRIRRRFESGRAAAPTAGAGKEYERHPLLKTVVRGSENRVVLVDFWSTGCAPCRSSIRSLEPHKEKLAARGVDFVYVADHTSPPDLWQRMKAGIAGRHYRVLTSEAAAVCDRFGLRGWPSYIVVGRDGRVVWAETGTPVERLLEILDREAAKKP